MAKIYHRQLVFLFLVFIITGVQNSRAQEVTILDSINFNVHLQVHTSYFSDHFELGQNVPRIGTGLYRSVGEKIEIFGRLEYGVNLSNGTQFNNNANSPSEFVNEPFQEPEPFTSRLGYVGISHKTLGTLIMGKQWGSYYDVGGFTDAFTVFGSSAVDVYAGNTDGGWKGTGRSDATVLYRNHFNKFRFSIQTQLFGSHENFGSALVYSFKPNLNLGIAYNRAQIPEKFRDLVIGLESPTNNYIFGGQYFTSKFYSGLTFAIFDDEFVRVNDETLVSFPVFGMEAIGRYALNPRIKVEGGFNFKWEQTDDSYFDGDYRLLQFYGGINYYFGEFFSIYLQGRLDNSRNLDPVASANVILIGFSFDLNRSIKFQHKSSIY